MEVWGAQRGAQPYLANLPIAVGTARGPQMSVSISFQRIPLLAQPGEVEAQS